jgi:hypothetical protein
MKPLPSARKALLTEPRISLNMLWTLVSVLVEASFEQLRIERVIEASFLSFGKNASYGQKILMKSIKDED